MRFLFLLVFFMLAGPFLFAQVAVQQRLQVAMRQLEADSQLRHALYSLYVVDNATGKVVYDRNSEVGLAPASCQKVITACAALTLLGADFQYATTVGYDGLVENGVLRGSLYVTGSGDPTLGSWRYGATREVQVWANIKGMLDKVGIKSIVGQLYIDVGVFSGQPIPGGWIWEDIGNYYGAGAQGVNWRENQYDLRLQPGGHAGDAVQLKGTHPLLDSVSWTNRLRTGEKGSGDNSYIYLAPFAHQGVVEGTIAPGEGVFTIAGALPDPAASFGEGLSEQLVAWGISLGGGVVVRQADEVPAGWSVMRTNLGRLESPGLDSMVYWFLKKSINLYGEALVKTLSVHAGGAGRTEKGVALVRSFWAVRGVEQSAFHIEDGSGLSPQNRVTTNGLVQVLQFARRQGWFPAFYTALPVINNMTMKSGSIGGARSYCGYAGGADGKRYTFAFIINNYDGGASAVQRKMWKVLDLLKPGQ